jgi:hypothetical protein
MTPERTSAAGSTASKMGLLGSLYFSQGLPFGFFTQALPVMLRKQGFSSARSGWPRSSQFRGP